MRFTRRACIWAEQTSRQAAQGSRIAQWSRCCSGFVAPFGMLSGGIAGGADFANPSVAAAGSAVLSAVEDDLQMKRVPASFWKGAL